MHSWNNLHRRILLNPLLCLLNHIQKVGRKKIELRHTCLPHMDAEACLGLPSWSPSQDVAIVYSMFHGAWLQGNKAWVLPTTDCATEVQSQAICWTEKMRNSIYQPDWSWYGVNNVIYPLFFSICFGKGDRTTLEYPESHTIQLGYLVRAFDWEDCMSVAKVIRNKDMCIMLPNEGWDTYSSNWGIRNTFCKDQKGQAGLVGGHWVKKPFLMRSKAQASNIRLHPKWRMFNKAEMCPEILEKDLPSSWERKDRKLRTSFTETSIAFSLLRNP